MGTIPLHLQIGSYDPLQELVWYASGFPSGGLTSGKITHLQQIDGRCVELQPIQSPSRFITRIPLGFVSPHKAVGWVNFNQLFVWAETAQGI